MSEYALGKHIAETSGFLKRIGKVGLRAKLPRPKHIVSLDASAMFIEVDEHIFFLVVSLSVSRAVLCSE